jgi:hypothetical protein
MWEAAAWGAVAASSLVLGSLLTFWLKPGRRLIGLVMAFGAGTLISAIAYDLVEEAAASGRPLSLALGLALGALAFFAGDRWVGRLSGERSASDPAARRRREIPWASCLARCWTASRSRSSWARRCSRAAA